MSYRGQQEDPQKTHAQSATVLVMRAFVGLIRLFRRRLSILSNFRIRLDFLRRDLLSL